MSTVTIYPVVGMTCGHCVQSVTEEIQEIPGVTAVSVDVPTGLVRVTSEQPLADSAIAAAVSEAGYALGPDAPHHATGDRGEPGPPTDAAS